jgi:four helix bundle protein
MQDFRKLIVWQKAHELALAAYRATLKVPRVHTALASQIRRSAISIPANIAEGCGRDSRPEFARFLRIAAASSSELEYHLQLAKDVGLFNAAHHESLDRRTCEVRRMLAALVRRLTSRAGERRVESPQSPGPLATED